jgi:hypothetical protein
MPDVGIYGLNQNLIEVIEMFKGHLEIITQDYWGYQVVVVVEAG